MLANNIISANPSEGSDIARGLHIRAYGVYNFQPIQAIPSFNYKPHEQSKPKPRIDPTKLGEQWEALHSHPPPSKQPDTVARHPVRTPDGKATMDLPLQNLPPEGVPSRFVGTPATGRTLLWTRPRHVPDQSLSENSPSDLFPLDPCALRGGRKILTNRADSQLIACLKGAFEMSEDAAKKCKKRLRSRIVCQEDRRLLRQNSSPVARIEDECDDERRKKDDLDERMVTTLKRSQTAQSLEVRNYQANWDIDESRATYPPECRPRRDLGTI